MTRKVLQFKKKHINKYWNEPFSAALASDAVVARLVRLIFTHEAQNLEIREGTRVVPPLAVLQSEVLMDGVRFKPGRERRRGRAENKSQTS